TRWRACSVSRVRASLEEREAERFSSACYARIACVPGMLRTLVAMVCTFLNVPALMTVVPLLVQLESGNPADGRLVTAMFSVSTVCAELLMPTLMGRHRPGRL